MVILQSAERALSAHEVSVYGLRNQSWLVLPDALSEASEADFPERIYLPHPTSTSPPASISGPGNARNAKENA